MAANASSKKLNILNPGFNRDVASSPNGLYLRLTRQGVLREDWWTRLPWWESPLQAKAGIKALCMRPFLQIMTLDGKNALIPTQRLYPNALLVTDDERIEQAAVHVAAYMREGRELYTAAESSGVTDLSRPILYYYGALAYAKAAITALFGVEADQDGTRHGLKLGLGPTTRHPDSTSWPSIITWQQKGVFSQFYQVTRWDQVWKNWDRLGTPQSPQFHVLECIRYTTDEWGTLPSTGFHRPRYASDVEHPRHPKEQYLLAYQSGNPLFLTRNTPPTALFFQVPQMVVRFMLLHYFSMVARYHAAQWQDLLGGANEPEGFVFRAAYEDAAYYFVRDISGLLPYPDEGGTQSSYEIVPPDPALGDWLIDQYQYPYDSEDTPST